MKTLYALVLATLLAVAVAPVAQADQAIAKSDNVKHVKQIPFERGTELAKSGRFLYAASNDDRGAHPGNGGLHIIDTKTLKEVGYLHCPGSDNDIEVVRPGLVVMSFTSNICAPVGEGLMLIDVKNAKKPRVISSLNTGHGHTIKPVPGTSLIYMAKGDYVPNANYGPAVVDVANPAKPKIVAQPKTLTIDCHDISFSMVEEDRQLGFCAGALNGTGEVQIWDVSDPLNPVTIGRIVNPAIQYSHYAVANHDGTLLAIDDEAFALHDCNTGQSPTGRVWLYDITNPQTPLLTGSYAPPRGGDPAQGNIGWYGAAGYGWLESWCLSHGLDWHPNTNNLAVTWFTGGVSVIDVT
ncbi:MAG: hypothetical protein M3161_04395, partial [Actinomycetota bacterium]|nr:hypothetical protein [Actinomycetota bacterium]